uniref:Uncharacterized protein n=1 Tax=Aegilops tauschii subsp. strangulata TaxID=200361 RepID=A0A453MY87_AEGTS
MLSKKAGRNNLACLPDLCVHLVSLFIFSLFPFGYVPCRTRLGDFDVKFLMSHFCLCLFGRSYLILANECWIAPAVLVLFVTG